MVVVGSFFGGSFPPAGYQSVPHLLFSVVQVWEGCVGAGSSMCTRFSGFSLALVRLFVLNNFLTIYLYFQIGPGLT